MIIVSINYILIVTCLSLFRYRLRFKKPSSFLEFLKNDLSYLKIIFLNNFSHSSEERHEGQGSEAFLQGHRAGQRHDLCRRLCRVPLTWTASPAVRGPHREHVGVVGRQHGGEGEVVLPPRGDQAGQEAP